ncbi:hypothetical protein DPMN_159548 [Dreissena polymorpha]|uniref:Fibrinogen C-terminal domain-containing protein n=1 Tax=Dreissena polymorpha TaxID=45954 RepID=A0A9D4EJW0_DREPO|nr:hypothetical protein DPMN_159548 [Dreissena polymorpha]
MTFYSRSELRIELMNSRLRTGYGMYSNFWVSASPNYTLNVDRGHGNISLEDTFGMDFYAGYRFLTYDNGDINNASLIGHGGWWYRGCSYCGTVNLNGQYITPGTRNYPYEHAAVFYYSFDLYFSLKETKMMFRRI